MACEYDHDLHKVLEATYKAVPKKKELVAQLRTFPGVAKHYGRTDHQACVGYISALADVDLVHYHYVNFNYGSAGRDTYILRDKEAFLAELQRAFPISVLASIIAE